MVNAGQNDIGTSMYTPRLRALKKEASKAVKAYGSGLERIERITLGSVEELAGRLAVAAGAGEAVDVLPELYTTVINTLCVLMFGRQLSADDPLIARVVELDHQVAASFQQSPSALLLDAAPVTRFLGNKVWPIVQKTVQCSHDFWQDYIVPHRAEYDATGSPRGVADALFAAYDNSLDENGNRMFTEDNIRLALQNVVVAGSATTTNSLYAFLNIMLHHPEVQSRIHAEIDQVVGSGRAVTLADKATMHYTRAALLELLRYHSVNPLSIPHTATRGSTIQGFHVAEGTIVLMNLWAAHHDPACWPDPFTFRPERFLAPDGSLVAPDHPSRKRLFPFGAGVRVCMGETLAMNRLFLIIATILQRFQLLPPEGSTLVSCDPRDYKLSILLSPLPYKLRLVPRK